MDDLLSGQNGMFKNIIILKYFENVISNKPKISVKLWKNDIHL